MPAISDFRSFAFDSARVQASGKYIGRNVYWKLYSIENIVRVIINTVLQGQLGPTWWALASNPKLANKALRVKSQYSQQPWHTQPGAHDIYYLFLPDLNEIIRANSNLFLPIVPDIDQWLARLEQIRLPRNIVGHMNWPSNVDRKRVDVLLSDLLALIQLLQRSGIGLLIA
jgi:hypothetical protein